MSTRTTRTLTALTAGLAVGFTCHAQQAPGIVRVSDGGAPAPSELAAPTPDTDYVENCPVSGGYVVDGYGAGGYETGDHVVHGPGYTYGPPQHRPVVRYPVVYTKWYPDRWYGTPGPPQVSPAPMVYMPTDTTQMGYYYQVVPRWQPRHNPYPKPWFVREREVTYGGYHGGYPVESYGTPVESYHAAPVDGGSTESAPSDAPQPLDPGPANPVPDDLPNVPQPANPGAPSVPQPGGASEAPALPQPSAGGPIVRPFG